MKEEFSCRPGCGACCTAISISAAIPGVNGVKLAGQRCPQLDEDNLCLLWDNPLRPKVCNTYQASREFCGDSNSEAFQLLESLEKETNG